MSGSWPLSLHCQTYTGQCQFPLLQPLTQVGRSFSGPATPQADKSTWNSWRMTLVLVLKKSLRPLKATVVPTCHMKCSSVYDCGILWSILLINNLSRNCSNKSVFLLLQCFGIVKRLSAFLTPMILNKTSVQHSLSSDAGLTHARETLPQRLPSRSDQKEDGKFTVPASRPDSERNPLPSGARCWQTVCAGLPKALSFINLFAGSWLQLGFLGKWDR